MDLKNSILLRDYMLKIKGTDKLPQNDLQPVLMGLFGEVGSIMATVKKNCREKTAYAGYQQAVREEFGDTLWYFTILCRRLGIGIDTILSEVANQKDTANSSLQAIFWMVRFLISRQSIHCALSTRHF